MATSLLMHGGGMGGWTWKYMRALLEAEGHTVFTPTFTGFGERVHLIGRDVGNATHVTDIVNVLHYEDLSDVILVAHSYAGTVAPGFAGGFLRAVGDLAHLLDHLKQCALIDVRPTLFAETGDSSSVLPQCHRGM